MATPYAEVIGDPIAHSKSPLIHGFWLQKLGLKGEYRKSRVGAGELPRYLESRCADPFWRGCNVTAPLKGAIVQLIGDPTGVCGRIGAANAVFRSPLGCGIGANTDVYGVSAALDDTESLGNQVCVIGAGGAAKAVLEFLRIRGTMEVSLIVRDIEKGRAVHGLAGAAGGIYSFYDCEEALAGAEWVINATPLGMTGMPPMPQRLLEALAETEEYALIFDMVYSPLDTALLKQAKKLGRKTVDGLVMLVAQAAPAFELFFGVPAPCEHDEELRALLAS